jgi:hypothetical protein
VVLVGAGVLWVLDIRKKPFGVLGVDYRKIIWGTGGSDVLLACIFELKISSQKIFFPL